MLEVPAMIISRYEGDTELVVVASRNARRFTVGSRWTLDEPGVAAQVYATGRPARIDDYSGLPGQLAAGARDSGLGAVVGVPVMVEGRIWGVCSVATRAAELLPPGIEDRLRDFADLVGIAIANAESRRRPRRLAEEQAALRRVATLVAEGAAPAPVFMAVAKEVAHILDVAAVTVVRFESDETSVVVASHNDPGFPVGSRWPLDGPSLSATVFQTGLPARIDDQERLPGSVAAAARASGVRSGVAVPIMVDGRVWGMIGVGLRPARATLPAHTGILSSRLVLSVASPQEIEQRLAAFTELVATAIANADTRDQLTASRARLLSEADEARRRVVRDLHDGAQQRLVHTIVTLRLAQQALRSDDPQLELLLAEGLEQAKQGNEELRELAHGVLPSALTRDGLRAGVDAVVKRLDLPVEVDVPTQRLPAEIEASAYFIVAEALTNVAKHARATRAEIRAAVDDGMLRVEVRDDGIGGADASGHGLVGLRDRASTLGGRLGIESARGGGTVVTATLPIPASRAPGTATSARAAHGVPRHGVVGGG